MRLIRIPVNDTDEITKLDINIEDLKDITKKIRRVTEWEDGSFTIAKMTFDDGKSILVCDYPTNLSEPEAQEAIDNLYIKIIKVGGP